MTAVASNAFRVEIVAPASSVLAQAAQSMAVGTWLNFPIPNLDSVLVTTGSSNITFSNSMAWDAFRKKMVFIGADHGAPVPPIGPGLLRIEYDEATHTVAVVPPHPGVTGHGYGHTTVNPFNGDIYHQVYNSRQVKRFNGTSWSNLPLWTGLNNITASCAWWKSGLSGVGVQGAYVAFNPGNGAGNQNDGQIIGYDPIAAAWTINFGGAAPNAGPPTYSEVVAMSDVKNCFVYSGPGYGGRMFRMNADRSTTELTTCPITVGVQSANIVPCPVSGDILILRGGVLRALNPSGVGTYSTLTGSRTPPPLGGSPMGVGDPGAPHNVVSGAIPDHGVDMYWTATTSAASCWLFKHA
jgi:hypothetical protein